MNIISSGSLAVWNIPEGWRWACYYLAGFGGGLSGLCFAWAHEICTEDNEERAIVVGTMNEMAYILQAWLPLLVWQQVDAPEYHKGFVTVSCLSALLILTAFAVRYMHRRQLTRSAWSEAGVHMLTSNSRGRQTRAASDSDESEGQISDIPKL